MCCRDKHWNYPDWSAGKHFVHQYRRHISPEGGLQKWIHAVAMADWRVSLKERHEGYITLEELFKNQERLAKNRTNGEETLLAGPAREGLALSPAVSLG